MANRSVRSCGDAKEWYASFTPTTTDFSVAACLRVLLNAGAFIGPIARMATSAKDGYHLLYIATGFHSGVKRCNSSLTRLMAVRNTIEEARGTALDSAGADLMRT